MTIGRLEYTSCEDGVEGIRGFQVRAISAHMAGPLREAAVRDSVYEPSVGLPSMPDARELASFPVAMGYTPVDPGLVFFRSNYVGRDHTGRWGNYFAQALTLDSTNELDRGLLPIDLWESPVWRATSACTGSLPALPPSELQPGIAAGVEATLDFLAAGGRHELFASVLATVREVAAAGRGRLVIVVDDTTSAALWLSAITRSVPRPMALDLSFTTYTSRPESHRALMAFTTPDVAIPSYGDYRVIDLSSRAQPLEPTGDDYDRIVAEIWRSSSPRRLMAAAEHLDPPAREGDLELTAQVCVLFGDHSAPIDWQEDSLLSALEFAIRRMPRSITAPWDQVVAAVQQVGGMQETARWGWVLRSAAQHAAPVPGPLRRGYLRLALDTLAGAGETAEVWIPELSEVDVPTLASGLVAPSLLAAPSPAYLNWLAKPGQRALLEETLRCLSSDMAGYAMEDAANRIPATSATFLVDQAGEYPGLWMPAHLALVKHGQADAAVALGNASTGLDLATAEAREFVERLWPEQPPTIEQAVHLLDLEDLMLLRAGGLLDQFVERLVDDAVSETGVTSGDIELANRLTEQPLENELSAASRPTVGAVRLIGYFRECPAPGATAAESAHAALDIAAQVNDRLVEQLYAELSRWLLVLEPEAHRGLLTELATVDGRLQTVYGATAKLELARATPDATARVIVAWRGMVREPESTEMGEQLLNEVLSTSIADSSRRHLDRIGECLPQSAEMLGDGSSSQDDWEAWWQDWRSRFEERGLFSRFKRRGSPRERR